MIRILVDSSTDFTMEEVSAKNLYHVPLTISLNGQDYLSGENLTSDQFYELLTTGEDFPKTSQPSPQAFAEIFEKAKKQGEEIICVLLSSALSGTCQSAHLAKDMVDYDGIYIVDSLTATIMTRVIVDYGLTLIEQGKSAPEIVNALESIKSKVKVAAGIDTLEYLYRGGRLNKATATIGELANLKPVISVTEEGTVSILGKCIGKNKALQFILKTLNSKELNPDFPLYSVYAYGSENTEKLEEKLTNEGYAISARLQLGSTIGAHVGPGAFGIIYVEK
ncbi:MAG: DegV family protein [Lachnospiraceae bacterium]|nr:DegV family protein [Lachnospiraceae bacterium]